MLVRYNIFGFFAGRAEMTAPATRTAVPFEQTNQRLRLIVPLGFGARRAVKTTPSALEERDASTPVCGLARYFACVKA